MSVSKFSHEPQVVDKVTTSYRNIVTSIPVPESIPLLNRVYETESHSMHGQMPIIWDRAEGFQVYDAWGNKWLDFSSTIFVTNAGHGNKRIVDALRKVLDKPLLHTYTYTSPERYAYLDYLISNTPKQFEKAFLVSSGSEATEATLKLMRLNGQKVGKKRGGIICFEGNWHGRTMGSQMMGWNPGQKEWIGYLDPNIYHLPFPYPWRNEAMNDPAKYFKDNLESLCKDKGIDPQTDICGIMLETFQGWGAVFYPKEFVQAIALFAKENSILLTFDEMQAGFGRTGELFGYMHYGVEPDLLACGKGTSSSLPLGLVLGSKEIMDLPGVGSMSSTHSANPLVCAAGHASLQALLEDGLIENSKKLGLLFHEKLNELKAKYPNYISSIQGVGLVAAVIFNDKKGNALSYLCDMISEKCLQSGLLVVHTGRESIKLAPPLLITEEALLEGIEVLSDAVESCINSLTIMNTRHTGIVVKDLNNAVKFYEGLGLTTFSRMFEEGDYIDNLVGLRGTKLEWAKLRLPDNSLLELLQYHSHPSDENNSELQASNQLGCSHIAFSVSNIEIAIDYVTKNGGSIKHGFQYSPDGNVRVLYGYDMEGNIIELVEEIKASNHSSLGPEQIVLKTRHTGIVFTDLERAIKFYEGLGFVLFSKMIEEGEYIDNLVGLKNTKLEWAKMKAPDQSLVELLQYHNPHFPNKRAAKQPANRLGCSHIAFTVGNIEKAVKYVIENGGSIKMNYQHSPDGNVKVIYCYDIEGNILEIVQELK